MAQVKVEHSITIRANDVSTVHYPAGFTGRVPRDHAERIAAVGAGTHLDAAEPDADEAGPETHLDAAELYAPEAAKAGAGTHFDAAEPDAPEAGGDDA